MSRIFLTFDSHVRNWSQKYQNHSHTSWTTVPSLWICLTLSRLFSDSYSDLKGPAMESIMIKFNFILDAIICRSNKSKNGINSHTFLIIMRSKSSSGNPLDSKSCLILLDGKALSVPMYNTDSFDFFNYMYENWCHQNFVWLTSKLYKTVWGI